MSLTPAQKRYLRGLAHPRRPVVWIGQHGATEAVRRELLSALEAHELVKVSIRVGDRVARDALVDELSTALGALVVQRIGNVLTLYRPHPREPKLRLPRE